jgi:hypothetical protein
MVIIIMVIIIMVIIMVVIILTSLTCHIYELLDATGNFNGACTFPNCPTYTTGVVGNAASFDGTKATFTLGAAGLMGFASSSFTLMAWVQVIIIMLTIIFIVAVILIVILIVCFFYFLLLL